MFNKLLECLLCAQGIQDLMGIQISEVEKDLIKENNL
jgi:hypothetical protein